MEEYKEIANSAFKMLQITEGSKPNVGYPTKTMDKFRLFNILRQCKTINTTNCKYINKTKNNKMTAKIYFK